MRSITLPLLLSVTLAMLGCSGKDTDILGKWNLRLAVPIPKTTSTDITFTPDHIFSGVLVGSWKKSDDILTMTISSYVGLPIDAVRSLTAPQSVGTSASKSFQSITLKVDKAGKTMFLINREGKTSLWPLLARP